MKTYTLAAAAVLCLASQVIAQQSPYVLSIAPSEAPAGTPAMLTIDVRQRNSIGQMFVLVRPFGSSLFQKLEMEIAGNQARVIIPAKIVTPPYLEYYVVIDTRTGKRESYPGTGGGDPLTHPPAQTLRLSVAAPDTTEPQVMFLSPERDIPLSSEDVVISLSLLRADSMVVRRATEIYLDGANVTKHAVFSDDIVVIVPDNYGARLSPGIHSIGVRLFGRQGKVRHTATHRFTVRAEDRASSVVPPPRAFTYSLSMQGEARREFIRDSAAMYLRGGYQFRGSTGIWNFTSNGLLSSDESPILQPQHRYFFGVGTPWADVGYGDAFPSFPDLIMSGKRIRGLHSSVHYDIMKVDVVWGQTTRAIEGEIYKTFPADSFGVEYRKDSTAAYGRITPDTWGKFTYGTYSRSLFAVRPSIGPGDTWQVGFSWLHSVDDTGSIQTGIRPQENIVLGTDFIARFDQQRVELSGQGAFSAFNSDISSGSFTDSYIDSVYPSRADQIKKTRDMLSGVITVNDNLRPLSLDQMCTAAYDLSLGLNYFNNLFKFTYLFRGSEYTSFGQSFVRTDIRGFSIVDRVGLVENQVFMTAGFEQLEDNTAGIKAATTTTTNLNISVSYLPRVPAPTLTIGFSLFANDNGIGVNGRDSLLAIDDNTNRFFLRSSFDFKWGARHTASVGVSASNRVDASLQHNDVRTISAEAGLNTIYTIPLRTSLSIGVHLNTLPVSSLVSGQGEFNYTMVSLHGRYEIVRDIFSLMITIGPTFGDYKRTMVELESDWQIRSDLSVQAQISVFRTAGFPSDNIMSLRCRYSI